MFRSRIENFGEFQVKNARTIKDQHNGEVDPPSVFYNNDDGQGHHGTVTKLAGAVSTFGAGFQNNGGLLFNGFAMTFTGGIVQAGANSTTELGGGTLTTPTLSPFI
jgi:hypothetical protein